MTDFETGERIAQAIGFSIALLAGAWGLVLLLTPIAKGHPSPWQLITRAIKAWFIEHFYPDMSTEETDEGPEIEVVEDVAATATDSAKPIATGQTAHNDALLIAALAKLIHAAEQKPLAQGKIPQTWGLKLLFGVTPSSTSPRYLELRDMLKAELAHLDPPEPERFPPLTVEQAATRDKLGLEQKP